MNIIKTATISFILLLVLSLAWFFIPFDKLINSIPYFNSLYNNTSLSINSRNGKATVVINGTNYGETPVTITSLTPGDYDITLTKVSSDPNAYTAKDLQVTLERDTESIVDIEIGPSNITAGYVLYYTKTLQSTTNQGLLTLISNPKDANTYLDNEILGKTPIEAYKLSAKDYQMKITKEGYEDLSFPVIVRNGYNLNIQSYLYPLPTIIKK